MKTVSFAISYQGSHNKAFSFQSQLFIGLARVSICIIYTVMHSPLYFLQPTISYAILRNLIARVTIRLFPFQSQLFIGLNLYTFIFPLSLFLTFDCFSGSGPIPSPNTPCPPSSGSAPSPGVLIQSFSRRHKR